MSTTSPHILVYIHPKANANTASESIKNTVNRLELISPDSPKFILGDFNHCPIDKSLKKFQQYITCATRFDRVLDKCYGSISGAYKSVPLPPLGTADHNSILLVPEYTPVVKRREKVVKSVKQWNEESIDELRACFECTSLDIFLQPDLTLNEQVDILYIFLCR